MADAKPQAWLDGAVIACRWDRTLMVHFEVAPAWLQALVPFELDLREGRAFVSLVAFTLCDVRLRPLGPLGRWLCRPFWPVRFLNVRTYVRSSEGEAGIYFLTEWLSSRLTVMLEPMLFGLPYCLGRLRYAFPGILEVRDARGRDLLSMDFDACPGHSFAPCAPGTLDAFLMERYVAFTDRGRRPRRFRVWHRPWLQVPVTARVRSDALLRAAGVWPAEARNVGANYATGVDALIGRPVTITDTQMLSHRPHGQERGVALPR